VEVLGFLYRGADLYVKAFCVERDEERTFKVARVQDARITQQRASRSRAAAETHDSGGNGHAATAPAIKVWSGEPVAIRVRLSPQVAWMLDEYALPDQKVARDAKGFATVSATVAGIVEAAQWVIRWGDDAEVLEPPELRSRVEQELVGALSRYLGPGIRKAVQRLKAGEKKRVSH
jgi:predicted DNA-binding transcriptional regulator YafY